MALDFDDARDAESLVEHVTSMTETDLACVGIDGTVDEQVERPAVLARDSGCDGVVASPAEAGPLRALLGPEALIVTPGVSFGDPTSDHARTGTPAAALRSGASHVILGRGVSKAADPVAVMRERRAAIAV
ncbi:orotidine 5'-phosphate decarboxylase / HUMPS family protein [Phytomonospora sp. NPDC050363]|uniref:orotidine 5'-phosphate decarboxylase / HUMPS family protein n=1 Tax=Phytomonospora sp. NPDC050363 TaxID=3155642 RepID=UPI0033DEF39C